MRYSGVVKKVLVAEGFGFIKGTDGVERFFHRTSLIGIDIEDLRANHTQVTFEHEDGVGTKGPRAIDVHVV